MSTYQTLGKKARNPTKESPVGHCIPMEVFCWTVQNI